MARWSTEDFEGSRTTLPDPPVADTHHYAFVQTHGVYDTESDHHVCRGLWGMTMCPWGSITCNRCPTLGGGIDGAGGCGGGGRGIWEIRVPSPQFCNEPETALKKVSPLVDSAEAGIRSWSGRTWFFEGENKWQREPATGSSFYCLLLARRRGGRR